MSVGFTEMMLIVLFVVVVFGAKRIPELARSLGRAQYEFNKAKNSVEQEKAEIMGEQISAKVNQEPHINGAK
jgi:sec-independent protein translocase protein TatA